MLVCVCKAVSDKTVRWLVQNGATTLSDVAASCRAGTDCGTCVSQLRQVIAEARSELDEGSAAALEKACSARRA